MRLLPLLAVLPLFAVACATGANDEGSSVSNLDEASQRLEIVKGRDYARCWFDVTGADATLSCTSTARGNDPIGAVVRITVAAGMSGGPFVSLDKELDIEAGGTVTVGSIPRSAFPATVLLNAKLTAEGRKEIGEQKGVDFSNNGIVSSPEEMPAAKARTIGQPYDLWPVAFLDARQDASYSLTAVEYTRAIAPYTDFLSQPAMTLRPTFSTREQGTKPRWFVAPASGPISLNVAGGPRGVDRAQITGPGYYIATDTELRLATSTEIARAVGGSAPAETPVSSGADAGGDAPPSTAGDTDPSCGGDGQGICRSAAKKCDDGTRYSSPSSTCVACGDAGQTYCTKAVDNFASAGGRCNDGTRWNNTACVACGNAGQTYCTKALDNFASAGARCNDGTRWNGTTCTPCGAEGQTFCTTAVDNFASSGARCNAGLRLSSSTSLCVK